MTPGKRLTAVLIVLLVLCLGGQAVVVRRLDKLRPAATLEEVLYVPSARILRWLSLGHSGLLADIYWTRAVQYFGKRLGNRTLSQRYDLLYPLLDITTDLDPQLIPAYEFGATFLTQPPPMGAGQPRQAVALLQKGIAANPGKWRLYFALGFVNYLELKDYQAAARAFRQAGEMPGGNPNVLPIAAKAATHGGELETARQLWLAIYESTNQELIKKNAERHLMALQVDMAVPLLEGVVARYRERTGSYPISWSELVRAGYLPGVPRDPAGNPYRLLPAGKVVVQDTEKLPFITKGLPPEEPTAGTVPRVQ